MRRWEGMFACSSSANTQTFYIPVKPFTAAAGKKLTVYVNGSYRDITLEKELKFEAGKITTISVPVLDYSYNAQTKEGHPYESDVFGKTSQGRVGLGWDEKTGGSIIKPTYTHYDDNTYGPYEIFSLNNCDSLDVVINGKTCKAYVVGGNSTTGSIIVRGFAKDLINALPIGFYASRYNDTPTAMTIDYVNAWLPEYGKTNYKTDYSKLETRKDLSTQYGTLAGYVGFDLVAGKGVTRDLIVNKLGIAASTITFNGIVSNGNFDQNNVVVLDENPVYKEVSEKKVEEYLKKFGNDASLQGLKDILNSEFPEGSNTIQWSTEAENTGKAIYDKVYSVLERKAGSLTGLAMGVVGFSNYEALMYKMRDMRFEICIKTYPYAAKYTTTDLTSPLAPIIFWGFDAYGTDRSAPAN